MRYYGRNACIQFLRTDNLAVWVAKFIKRGDINHYHCHIHMGPAIQSGVSANPRLNPRFCISTYPLILKFQKQRQLFTRKGVNK